jgi:hypothetical protein
VRMCDALAAAAADGEAPIDWASVGDEGERGAGAVDKLAAQSPSNSARRGSVRSRPDTTS